MDGPRSAAGDRDASPAAKPESLDEIARMLFAPSAAEEGQPASDDDYRALYENLLGGGQGRVESGAHPTASRPPEPTPEQQQPPTSHPTPTDRPGASSLAASGTRPPTGPTPESRRPVARRPHPTKTTYRDAPKPLNGRVYNPVRFRSHYDPFDRGTRATPRQGEAREFSGHADEAASTGDAFRVYIIDDVEHKKGVERDCRLMRHQVHDIVWDLPEWVNRNGRTVHGVPPTPVDEYEVRVNPSHAGAPLAAVPMHDRTRVFLTVRNPPPAGPLVPFTVAPIPAPDEPPGLTVIDRVRRALDAVGTPEARAVVTARGEPLDRLDPNRDLVNLGQEVSLAVHARHMLAVRTALVARRFLVKDAMFRERALYIGPMSPALLQREAVGLVDRCRANGMGEDETVLSAEMPLRTYVIMRLAELGSERYSDAYLADPRFRESFKDRGPARLSAAQTEQLSDAFYWVHLAPEDRRVPKFAEVIRFYQQRGVEVRLNRPHVKSGASVGRTSESGALRSFKEHSMATHSVLQSRYKILAPSGEVQALRTVKPRTKVTSAVERNPAAARIDGLAAAAAAAARQAPVFASSPSALQSAAVRRLGNTGVARFLKASAPSTQPPAPKTDEETTTVRTACPKPVVVAAHIFNTHAAGDVEHGDGALATEGSAGAGAGAVATPSYARVAPRSCLPPVPSPTPLQAKSTAVVVKDEARHGDGAPRGWAIAAEQQPKVDPMAVTDGTKEAYRPTDSDSNRDPDGDQYDQGETDLSALRRRAIAFPDPIVVGAPPEGVTETVLTWASIRDKVAQVETAATPTSKQARGARKRQKTTKKRTKSLSASERAAATEKPRTRKRRRDAPPTRTSPPTPSAVTPHVTDMATLMSLLPRQGESLVLPIVHLRPPEGASILPGFGAPYVRLPCPALGPYSGGPQRMLIQQLPVLAPPVATGGVVVPFGPPTTAPLPAVLQPVQPQADGRHGEPTVPQPAPTYGVRAQCGAGNDGTVNGTDHTGTTTAADNSNSSNNNNNNDTDDIFQLPCRWGQPDIGLAGHQDASADWLNLLSVMDSDRGH
ncbi:hypothetical protein psal_cds_368 [Pandoravirus salinus]|uniref:Uncharacterized protein n=1 Tax=Pandoravirus salinus TaxID=1349410 RepID=S4VX66_9VIRU|nr:Epstein-Barr virus nuclear antigen 3 incomplete domain [Pandoravirus salinus]AGO84036.1 hypothetical protein psal_cds_368 [Pandoravirus salinus]